MNCKEKIKKKMFGIELEMEVNSEHRYITFSFHENEYIPKKEQFSDGVYHSRRISEIKHVIS